MKGSIVEACRDILEARGVDTSGMYPAQVVQEAMSTSDLPHLLGTTLNRKIIKSYEEIPQTWRAWAVEDDVNDFREVKGIRITEFSDLDKIPQLGEYKTDKLGEEYATWRVFKWGKDFPISWESLVNDDLRGISKTINGWGKACRRTINKFVYSFLIDNPKTYDGKEIFHADHGNVITDVLGDTGLENALNKMMSQKDANSEAIGVTPKFLVVPTKLKWTGQKLLRSGTLVNISGGAIQTINDNVYALENLELVVEPLLNDDDARWFLAADPRTCESVEIDYLRGHGREPRILKKKATFEGDVDDLDEIDSLRFRARFVFGGGSPDHRGLLRSTGAGA
ncbi:MAG: Mu-like prophage major head subunit gpT family protein [bacterium]